MLSPAQFAFNTSQSFIENALEMFVKPASLGAEGYYDRKCMCHSARGGAESRKWIYTVLASALELKYTYVRLSVCLILFLLAKVCNTKYAKQFLNVFSN